MLIRGANILEGTLNLRQKFNFTLSILLQCKPKHTLFKKLSSQLLVLGDFLLSRSMKKMEEIFADNLNAKLNASREMYYQCIFV